MAPASENDNAGGAGTTSVARVPTASASRYLQQLAKHWSHRFTVDFTPEHGVIDFGGERLELTADAETLGLVLSIPPGGDVARMRKVVEEHIDRFAFREGPLKYDWRDGHDAEAAG